MTVHYINKTGGGQARGGSEPARSKRPSADELKVRARRVAAIAGEHASDVDSNGRFPSEALEAMRSEKLLGAMVPEALGGEGASISELAEVCYILGGACASSAMIYAMHQIKAACLVRHYGASAWHQEFLGRLVQKQLLLASSTTEGQGGGDVRSSSAAILGQGAYISLERAASVVSYGEFADAIVTTARRDPDAPSSDQVLVVFEKADYTLTRTLEWETLGMRGTRSAGFLLKAEGNRVQVLETPYAEIHAQSMTPVAHLLWSSAWAGLVASAVERARVFTRKAARSAEGQRPIGLDHFTKASASLRQLRALIHAVLARFEALKADAASLNGREFQTAVTLLKVEASELSVAAVMSAMRACGLSGYRTDGDSSLGRHLRDILSAPIMINNDRILANTATSSLLTEVPRSLFEPAESNVGADQ